MKKGVLLTFLITAILVGTLIPSLAYSAQNPSIKSISAAVPITMGLTGSGNAAKSFLMDLPNGVSASSIKTNTLKYSGNNTVIDAITIESGKIKLNLKGNEKTENFIVKGTDGSIDKDFITVPGNSIWRYADGRRWQINDYDQNKDINTSKDKPATDWNTPSEVPPKVVVTTKALPDDPSTANWYRNDGNGSYQVDYSDVIQSSIKPIPGKLQGDTGEAKVKNGKFVVTYTVPSIHVRPEEIPDYFKGGWATGRLYFISLPYHFTGSAKVTSYSYAGTVTFDYTLPTEPTLTGSVAVLEPNPNPAKFEGKDVAVKLSLKGELEAYQNSSNIEEWIFYAKEKGVDSTLQQKKNYSKTLSSNTQFDFTIPKGRLENTESYKQNYTLTVTVRFTKPVATKNGTITSLQESFNAVVEVYKKEPTIINPPNPTPPAIEGKPPVAVIMAPTTVKAGEEFMISGGGSYDPDPGGKIVTYNWDTPRAVEPIKGSSGMTWYQTNVLGTNGISLQVVDNDGMTDSTGAFIEVIEPLPVAGLRLTGSTKQNRKVTLTSISKSPKYYPLVDSKTKITISAVSGGANSDIKYSGTLSGITTKDVLFRQPGVYKATIYVENTEGYSDTSSVTFTIIPDEPPTILFSMQSTAYRDPQNGNKASIYIEDLSFTPDIDLIARRLWQYRYDSDSDGSFEDESWVTFSDGNLDHLNLVVSEVGRYEVRVTETEEFGQPTIDPFVTAADRRSADSYSSAAQPVSERIVEVLNRGPQGDWTW
ncbi:hypothetical protein [Paenibacillus sp. HW567]|uniref:hypothetical protein n=1 Tax=Paenibacillus sp. HW567 TaxID=1034769 RepID=UPI00036D424B|nr:hypothetical protein [Paenibacillus sp. HW567]